MFVNSPVAGTFINGNLRGTRKVSALSIAQEMRDLLGPGSVYHVKAAGGSG
jgi:hypothetical protein